MRVLVVNKYLHLLIAIIAFVLMFFSPKLIQEKGVNIDEFSAKLHYKEAIAKTTLDEIIAHQAPQSLFSKSEQYINYQQQGISFAVTENNQPIFWTDRSVSIPSSLKEGNGVVKLSNGWYEYLLEKKNNKIYTAFILLQHLSPIQNKYFKEQLHKSFEIDSEITIKLEKNENAIYSLNNQYLFSFYELHSASSLHLHNSGLMITLFFVGFIFLISFLSKQLRTVLRLRRLSPLIVMVFILLTRFLLLYFNVFNLQFELELFSPSIYAQSALLPSIGDLLITAIFYLLLIYYYNKSIQKVSAYSKVATVISSCIAAITPLLLADLIHGLITNSKINFDVNYLLDLDAYSFIGIGAMIIFIVASILFVKININHFTDKSFNRNQIISIGWGISLVSVIIGHFFFSLSFYLTGWILLVYIIFSFKISPKTSFYRSALLILIVSLTVSYGFIHMSKEKEQTNKEFIAKKISKERDPVAEFLFEDVEEKLKSDTLLINQIANYWNIKDRINEHLIDKYFGGYWSKYDVNIIYPCTAEDSIFVESKNREVNCVDFFDDKIEQESDNPFNLNNSLNFLYSEAGISSYLAKVKVESNSIDYYLFIEMFPKIFSKAEGYPELLLDNKNIVSQINTNQYSYAKYKKGKLIDNLGKFNYNIELNDKYRFDENGFCKVTYGNAYHVVYQSDKNTIIILSSPQKTMFNYITTFSYFFIITSLLVLFVGFFFRISPFNWQLALSDFSTKIQLFIIVSIFLSFILFGWATTYYIKQQNFEKNKTLLQEKVQSVLIELEHKLGGKNELTAEIYDEMTYYLVKFSNVFYTDINLYDKSGFLLASSRPEIYERELTSKLMDADAYKQIHLLKKSNYTHNENIGGLNYLSTYVPFRNESNQILAYMNLPYFSKQEDLDNELSSFYTALVNVYGLLFLISAVIAVFFANYISEPVRLIKDKISALQLGQSYELLEWQSNDEIGALVLEYNKKVMELEKSAQLLVQSERESAWREMAKQVAHEIKNPLTPMKLTIQQLQRLTNDDTVDINDRIDRTSKTLINQIDTLTKIADEFSNFAKMPKANEQQLDLIPVIETTIDLYSEEDVQVSFENNCRAKATVMADKDQISRMLTNIIKNAIQAIPEDRNGFINVVVNDDDDVLISIQDNGTGIPEDKKDKIFVPNFTTKTTGMGLGLAMVKNIVENANGRIWFETKENVGTTFFIQLKKA